MIQKQQGRINNTTMKSHRSIVVAFAATFSLLDVGWGFARIPQLSPGSTASSSVSLSHQQCAKGAAIWQLYVGSSPPTRLDRLTESLDKYILTGAPATRKMALDILQEIEDSCAAGGGSSSSSKNDTSTDQHQQELMIARRRMQRAGFNADPRHKIVEQRKQWEESRTSSILSSPGIKQPSNDAAVVGTTTGGGVAVRELSSPSLSRVATLSNSKKSLQDELLASTSDTAAATTSAGASPSTAAVVTPTVVDATAELVSELVAQAGASFLPNDDGSSSLGIGGLDDVLAEVKRRVWIPLAAPPRLLHELGIRPIRGLLLYGKPGCGKTLVAQKLGGVLSPLRPVTIVSGPEIMDKFVGSSEKNLRAIFDNPPEVYDFVKKRPDGEAIAKAALHVISRLKNAGRIEQRWRAQRGGKGGLGGDQGDAGVARDSVVNQLLAKMDGAAPLKFPTLVIGLTNKRSLIDPALLRPGRFEVHIEVPPPATIAQRVSILQVHTRHMHAAGRLHVTDAPVGSPAVARTVLPPAEYTYLELLGKIAEQTNGFSGASLAAVARSAASFALERAVEDSSVRTSPGTSHTMLQNCVVTLDDLQKALNDVRNVGETDHSNYETSSSANGDEDMVDVDSLSIAGREDINARSQD